MTNKVWPSGWVCQAVRAPGSKVTRAPATRAGSGGLNSGSIRTVPGKYSAGPLPGGWGGGEQRGDPDGAGEILGRSLAGGLRACAVDVHGVLLDGDGKARPGR